MIDVDFSTLAKPLLQQLLLFTHLVSFAFAFVLIAKADIAMLRGQYCFTSHHLKQDCQQTTWLLAILWISGLGLIAMGPGFNLNAILASDKITAKLCVVTILTLNGLLLHHVAFPMLAGKTLPSEAKVTGCVLLGAISSTSWLFAALIGAARIAAPYLNYHHFMGSYLLTLTIAVLIALYWARPRLSRQLSTEHSNACYNQTLRAQTNPLIDRDSL